MCGDTNEERMLMITARGISGQLAFDGHSVTITRRGFFPWLLTGSGGTKSIPLKSVSAVQHRRCGFYQGYLQLSIAGELEGGGTGHGRNAGNLPFVSDENTLVFYFKSNNDFAAIADTIRAAIRDAASGVTSAAPVKGSPAGVPAPVTATAPSSNQIFAEITQLAALRDAGAITAAEFNAKKSDLLSRL